MKKQFVKFFNALFSYPYIGYLVLLLMILNYSTAVAENNYGKAYAWAIVLLIWAMAIAFELRGDKYKELNEELLETNAKLITLVKEASDLALEYRLKSQQIH